MRSRSTRWLTFPAAAALALVFAGAGLAGWQAAAPPPPSSQVHLVAAQASRQCAAVEVVGLRGHGDSLTSNAGVGADVLALAERIEAARQRGGTTIYPLPYAQAPSILGSPVSVLRDLAPGADLLVAYLQRRAARCPQEAEVVIGQSEGAAIVHLALPRIARETTAAVLLGDPLHVGAVSYDQPGSATAAGQLALWMGIGRPSVLFGRPDPIGAGSAAAVRSYCLPDDRVCAFSLLDGNPDEHLQYRHNRSLAVGSVGVLSLADSFVKRALTNAAR